MALTVTPTDEMKTLKVGEKIYEIVDDQAREDVSEVKADFLQSLIYDTASGSVATFPDGADNMPCKSVVAQIVPKQAGSGDPSPDNIRPISGWDAVNVVRAGKTYSVPLPQTVYGGEVDVVSGEGKVTYGMVDLGTLTWDSSGTAGRFFSGSLRSVIKKGSASEGYDNAISSAYASVNASSLNKLPDCAMSVDASGNLQMYDSSQAGKTGAEFASVVSGVQLCYELATPTDLSVTPQTVPTLYGSNTVYADSGDVAVEYPADTKLYISRLTEPDSADMIADANIVSGKYFMVGNDLYLATANIANGGAITPGTNCTKVSLATALNAINS